MPASFYVYHFQYFEKLQESIVAGQPEERRTQMEQCFHNLMDGVEFSLLTKNRDRFTQNLSVFRREVNYSMKTNTSVTATTVTVGDMMQ